jgi:hypothetical protein
VPARRATLNPWVMADPTVIFALPSSAMKYPLCEFP